MIYRTRRGCLTRATFRVSCPTRKRNCDIRRIFEISALSSHNPSAVTERRLKKKRSVAVPGISAPRFFQHPINFWRPIGFQNLPRRKKRIGVVQIFETYLMIKHSKFDRKHVEKVKPDVFFRWWPNDHGGPLRHITHPYEKRSISCGSKQLILRSNEVSTQDLLFSWSGVAKSRWRSAERPTSSAGKRDPMHYAPLKAIITRD